MATQLRQIRYHLIKVFRAFNWLTGAIAIAFILYAPYCAYHTIVSGGDFWSFWDKLFPPFWSWVWAIALFANATIVVILTLTKESD